MQNRTSSVKRLTMQAVPILQLPHSFPEPNDFAMILSRLNPYSTSKNQTQFENEENVEEEQEFSFAPFDDQRALTFSDEIFDNGKMQTTSTNFDQYLVSLIAHDNNTLSLQPPLKKLFLVQRLNNFFSQSKGILKGLCKDTLQNQKVVEVDASNKTCKKSKSTGFSKTWRFRESFKLRSNSDGKDAFVLFNPSESMALGSTELEKDNGISKKGKIRKCKTSLSPHEKLYVMNKRRTETNKRRSFLPYRQNLIGFFANTNSFSRNYNPF